MWKDPNTKHNCLQTVWRRLDKIRNAAMLSTCNFFLQMSDISATESYSPLVFRAAILRSYCKQPRCLISVEMNCKSTNHSINKETRHSKQWYRTHFLSLALSKTRPSPTEELKNSIHMMYDCSQNWDSWQCGFPSTMLPQDRFKWWVFVNKVMNCRFLRNTVHCEVNKLVL